jgi:glycosyltransferase involved in cell wall biosynthesis
MTRVSVIIPCFNQSQYMRTAIASALAQTRPAHEVIVVNDGSTDSTAEVAAEYGASIRYVWQPNQGLAGARNTAIQRASGDYVAFLDCDDEWLPGFLEAMSAAVAAHPASAVLYCSARCIDSAGRELPQLAGNKQVPTGAMHQTLLEANFLIPSTVMAKRAVILAAGGFDPALRSCEDWDLFLRLARDHEFTAVPECLARYRIHEHSLSADVEKMLAAARAVIEKQFGPEAEPREHWSELKRLAFSSLYRNDALSYVLRRGDWRAAAASLRRGLALNPNSPADLNLFYELALGTQPIGFRGTLSGIDLAQNAQHVEALLQEVFGDSSTENLRRSRSTIYGLAYYALGLVAYNLRHFDLSRQYMQRAGGYPLGSDFMAKAGYIWLKAFLRTVLGHSNKPSI